VSQGRLRASVAAVALVPLLVYPLVVQAAGRRDPVFPGDRAECARPASGSPGEPVEVVAGHLATVSGAERLLERLRARGFDSMRVEEDGCGRWKVTDGVGSYPEGRARVASLAAAGFGARVEVDPSPDASPG
jgi:hypothetical protein